ncbi:MAG TPA: 5-oxoprolinase subunit PxpA [Fimbriimonadaceae bacterium]|nr:5-oxoprolinase subunit PxpA [Fimbriimonadaceae bacterium]
MIFGGDRRIDLNVDIGEGFPHDEALLEFATSANVGCGEHAGSWDLTGATVELCKSKGVRVGVHPGYPDRLSMGRRPMEVEEHSEFLKSLFDQVARFAQLVRPDYLKPHGAFYNQTGQLLPPTWAPADDRWKALLKEDPIGQALGRIPGAGSLGMILRIHRLPLMGLAGTAHEEIAKRAEVLLIREGFADRAYREDGTLVPRGEPGSVYDDPDRVRAQVLRLASAVDSICLHGDTPDALGFAELVAKTLRDAGYEVGA